MKTQRAYKFRLDPTPGQERAFLRFAGCRRFVWNWALDRKREVYRATGRGGYAKALGQELTVLRQELPWLAECQAQLLQQTLRDLDQAFEAFFAGRARFLRRKSRRRTPHAFRFPQSARIEDDGVVLPKVGRVRARLHREAEGDLKSCTVKRHADGHWYAVFVSHTDIPDMLPGSARPCGIDVGLSSFIALASGDADDGAKVAPPRFFRRGERKLRRLARRHSRAKQGGRNREKARRRLARYQARIAARRSDFLHQLSRRVVDAHDTICVEDLDLSALARTRPRGHPKSWHDAAAGQFLRMLTHKALWRGGQVVRVGRWLPSSRTCHGCGRIQRLELSDRAWACGCCGVLHDRDRNAAINILAEGLRIVAHGSGDTQNASRGGVSPVTTGRPR